MNNTGENHAMYQEQASMNRSATPQGGPMGNTNNKRKRMTPDPYEQPPKTKVVPSPQPNTTAKGGA
jgi:hypothetical protein